jgi:hypothetical protein
MEVRRLEKEPITVDPQIFWISYTYFLRLVGKLRTFGQIFCFLIGGNLLEDFLYISAQEILLSQY